MTPKQSPSEEEEVGLDFRDREELRRVQCEERDQVVTGRSWRSRTKKHVMCGEAISPSLGGQENQTGPGLEQIRLQTQPP